MQFIRVSHSPGHTTRDFSPSEVQMRALSTKARHCAAVGLFGSLTARFSRSSTNVPHSRATRLPCFAGVLATGPPQAVSHGPGNPAPSNWESRSVYLGMAWRPIGNEAGRFTRCCRLRDLTVSLRCRGEGRGTSLACVNRGAWFGRLGAPPRRHCGLLITCHLWLLISAAPSQGCRCTGDEGTD